MLFLQNICFLEMTKIGINLTRIKDQCFKSVNIFLLVSTDKNMDRVNTTVKCESISAVFRCINLVRKSLSKQTVICQIKWSRQGRLAGSRRARSSVLMAALCSVVCENPDKQNSQHRQRPLMHIKPCYLFSQLLNTSEAKVELVDTKRRDFRFLIAKGQVQVEV